MHPDRPAICYIFNGLRTSANLKMPPFPKPFNELELLKGYSCDDEVIVE